MGDPISIGLMVAGTAAQAGGQIIGANSEAKAMRSQARQYEINAGLERASAQREAMEQRRRGKIAQSDLNAAVAGSGAGATDPSVVNAMARVEQEGEYRSLTALYEGETSAASMEEQARELRRQAKATKTAGKLAAASTILKAGTTMADRYGG